MKSSLESIYELAKNIIFVLIAAFLIRYFVFQPFVVEGSSMEPYFHDKEYLIVDRLMYRIGNPQRGEVIVFEAPNSPGVDYIKRVVGLPGEVVKIVGNNIYVDNKIIGEKYLSDDKVKISANDESFRLEKKLGANEYFVMGDNRDHSLDSREIGAIKRDSIVGRAFFVLYPFEYFGKVFKPQY